MTCWWAGLTGQVFGSAVDKWWFTRWRGNTERDALVGSLVTELYLATVILMCSEPEMSVHVFTQGKGFFPPPREDLTRLGSKQSSDFNSAKF